MARAAGVCVPMLTSLIHYSGRDKVYHYLDAKDERQAYHTGGCFGGSLTVEVTCQSLAKRLLARKGISALKSDLHGRRVVWRIEAEGAAQRFMCPAHPVTGRSVFRELWACGLALVGWSRRLLPLPQLLALLDARSRAASSLTTRAAPSTRC